MKNRILNTLLWILSKLPVTCPIRRAVTLKINGGADERH